MSIFNKKMKNTVTLPTGETIHFFTKQTERWGWKLLSRFVSDDKKTATFTGVGRGLKEGHFIALSYSEGDLAHKIDEIEYESNPRDMFTAIVSGTYEFDTGDLEE